MQLHKLVKLQMLTVGYNKAVEKFCLSECTSLKREEP